MKLAKSIYRVTYKGWTFRDDCTEFFLVRFLALMVLFGLKLAYFRYCQFSICIKILNLSEKSKKSSFKSWHRLLTSEDIWLDYTNRLLTSEDIWLDYTNRLLTSEDIWLDYTNRLLTSEDVWLDYTNRLLTSEDI